VASFDAVRGLGVDAGAAVLLDGSQAKLITQPGYEGRGAYFLRPLAAPSVCVSNQPLSMDSVQVDKLLAGGTFDLGHWSGATTRYLVAAVAGVLSSNQPGGAVY
jgi:hypothetical protein